MRHPAFEDARLRRRYPGKTLTELDELDYEREREADMAEYVLDLLDKRQRSMQPGGLSSVTLTPDELDLIQQVNEWEAEILEREQGRSAKYE